MRKLQPDVVLMDISMQGTDGLEGLRIIRGCAPETLVIMLTIFDDNENIFQAICNGANGYLLKKTPPSKILDAIQEVYDGGAVMNPTIAQKVLDFFKPEQKKSPLSVRETEVLSLLAEGLSYKKLAEKLFVSPFTVDTHRRNLLTKLDVKNTAMLIRYAVEHKLI